MKPVLSEVIEQYWTTCMLFAERNIFLSRQLRRQIGVVRRRLTQKKCEEKELRSAHRTSSSESRLHSLSHSVVKITWNLCKKPHGLYKLCKGDLVVGNYITKVTKFRLRYHTVSRVRTCWQCVMMKLEFCNDDLCSFVSPTTKSLLQSLYKLCSFLHKYLMFYCRTT